MPSIEHAQAAGSTRERREQLLDAPRLPSGRHRIPRGEVVRNQRARIMAATVDVVATHGYELAVVERIASRAGVSRRTFYEQFSGKEDACICTYEAEARLLQRRVSRAGRGAVGLDGAVSAGLEVVLGTFGADPALARLLTVEVLTAGPALLARRDRRMRAFAGQLEAAARRRSGGALSPLAAQGLVGAIYELVYQRVVAGATDVLPALHADLLAFCLAQLRVVDAAAVIGGEVVDPRQAALEHYQQVLDRVYDASGELLRRAPTWQAGLYQSVRACYTEMRADPAALEMHFVTTAHDEAVQRVRTRHRARLLRLLFTLRDDAPEPTQAEMMLSMIHATMRAHIDASETPPNLDQAEQTFASLLFNAVPDPQ